MKRIIFVLVFISLIIQTTSISYAQNCNSWMKIVDGDLGASGSLASNYYQGDMVLDALNNIYLSGFNDYFLSKFDSSGNILWNISKPGKGSSDIALSSSGNIYATGTGALLCKYNSSGTELFAINIANTNPSSICVDNADNIYVSGTLSNAVFGSNTYVSGAFIAKFSSTGTLLWSKNITSTNNFVNCFGIITDNTFVYFGCNAGVPESVTLGTSTIPNCIGHFLVKVNVNGSLIWMKDVGSPNPSFVRDMAFDMNQNIITVGLQNSGDYYATLSDTAGIGLTIPPTQGGLSTWGRHVKVDSQNNYIKSGLQNTFSPNTVEIGGKANVFMSSSDFSYNSMHMIGLNSRGEILAALPAVGLTYVDMQSTTVPAGKILLVKFDANGRLLPNYSPSSITCGDSIALAVDDLSTAPSVIQQNLFGLNFTWGPTSGLSSSTAAFPKAAPVSNTQYTVSVNGGCPRTVQVDVSNPSTFNYSTNGMVASFAITGSTCSSFLWDFGNGNTSSINPNPIVTYSTPGTYSVCLKCNGQPNSCVKCLNVTVPSNGTGGVGITEIDNTNLVNITPNPFTNQTTIDFNVELKHATLKIFDIQGKEIRSMRFSGSQLVLSKGEMEEGIYFLQVMDENKYVVTRKIVIQ